MKIAQGAKKTGPSTHSAHYVPPDSTLPSNLDGVPSEADPLFFCHIAKCAKLTRKDIQYGMRVSKTTVDNWFSGKQYGPLKRARDFVELCRDEKQFWVIPIILEYVAGSDFNGAVLNEEQRAALMVLAKALGAQEEGVSK